MPIVSVGQITIVDVNDGVDGLDGPALQIISSAAGFTYQDGVASPADQTISFTLLRQGLDNTEANWAASGATLGTNKDRIDITEYIFGLPGTGDGDTAYLTLAQFGTARQMSIGATVGSLAAYANVSRIGESTAEAGATRNVLSGSWATATAYGVGDIVVSSGFRWICILAHISSGSIMPPVFPTTANTYWRLEGARGALTTSRAIAGSTWVDADAATAIADAGGVAPVQGDVVTLFNTTAGYSETRIRSSAGPWTALSVIFGGNVIVDNTLTASKIQANTITASKLLVADFSNMVQDPMMVDNSSWVSSGGTAWTTWGTSATENPTFRSTRFMKITGASGSYTGFHYSRWMPVEPGQSYYITAQGRSVGGIASGAQYNLEWAEDENRTGWVENSFTSTGSDTPVDVAQAVTAPAGKRFLRVRFYKNNNTVTEVRWGGLIVRRRTSGELIVDGSISTDKLAANTITAGKIAANTITASQIAANTITASQIAANTITAGQIAAGTIGASQIAAGAITASKLSVIDTFNLVKNPSFDGGSFDGWGGNGQVLAKNAVGVPSGAPSEFVRAVPVISGFNNDQVFAGYYDARSGDTFYCEWFGASTSDANAICRVFLQIADQTLVGFSWPNVATAPSANTAWTRYSGSYTIPDTFVFNSITYVPARVRIGIGPVANASPAGTWYFTKVTVRRAANAELIVDGAVTASKVAAGAITTAKLDASAVTADKVAANAITAAKIDAGAVTTAKIAAGAVTANEIAAATITGGKIAAGTITGSNIAADTITAGQIAAGAIGASEIAAGAITTDKLVVTGRGAALNDDPNTQDVTAWSGSGLSIITDSTSPAGNTVLRCAAAGDTILSRRVAIDPTRNYQFRIWTRQETGSSTTYLTAAFEDANGNNISGGASGWSNGTYHYFGLVNGALPAAWTEYRVSFGPNESFTIPAGARYIRVGVLSNYTGTGTQLVTGVRLMLKADADLIVDGAITANKIAANAIAVGTAAIQNGAIVNAMIGDMSATKITAGYTQSVDIEAGKFFGSQFYIGGTATYSFIDHDGNPNTAQIKNGIVSVSNPNISMTSSGAEFDVGFFKVKNGASGTPDSVFEVSGGIVRMKQAYMRGLAVTDANGDIILAAGTPLAASNITPASGWLNSNISINADGSLSGAGGGQVSSTGLGITGLTLINDNNCTQRGDTIQKVSGGSAWNAGMRSREAYSGGAFASATAPSFAMDAMFGLNSNPTTSSYTDIDHAIHLAGSNTVQVYEEGAYVGQWGTWSAGQTYTVQYDGTSIKYMRDGVVFHQRAVTKPDPLFFDSSLYQVGAQLLGVRFGPLSKTKGQNLLDTRTWVYGSYSAPAGFPQNSTSSGGSNYIAHDSLPDGSRGLLWRAQSGSATSGNAEGGWNSSSFPIDHTKLYRFTVWIRCFGGNSSGNIYLGPGESTVNDVGGGVNGNPYFFAQGRNTLVAGEWYLLAGYVLPSTYSGGQENISGLYRAATGQRVNAGTDYRWVSGQTTSHHRTYQYYTTAANNYQDFFDPRVELCDGTEPTLGELLAMGSPSARNQINASNASTYIASAAIGDAQIANTIQSTNYSSSAGWQINKAGTATFNEVALRGAINGGAYTGYVWPTAGTPAAPNFGVHLSASGLLLGNYNTLFGTAPNNYRKYFQIEASGNVYAPGFSIVDGSATFSGTLTAGIVNTTNIVGSAVTSTYTATVASGTTASVSVVVPASATSVVLMANFGYVVYYDGKTNTNIPLSGEIYFNGASVASNSGSAIAVVSPGAGTFTASAVRSYTGSRTMSIVALVAKR